MSFCGFVTGCDRSGHDRTSADAKRFRACSEPGDNWTNPDCRRLFFQRRGGKTGGSCSSGSQNSPTVNSASQQLGAQAKTRLAYSKSELAFLLGVSTRRTCRHSQRNGKPAVVHLRHHRISDRDFVNVTPLELSEEGGRVHRFPAPDTPN
jgi:hypothetical protein